jgi:hypothetical protein
MLPASIIAADSKLSLPNLMMLNLIVSPLATLPTADQFTRGGERSEFSGAEFSGADLPPQKFRTIDPALPNKGMPRRCVAARATRQHRCFILAMGAVIMPS